MTASSIHMENLTRCCLQASISVFLKASIAIDRPGSARVGVPFNADLTQNAEFVHGAILFEVADTAGFVAANSVEETFSVLTVDYHMNFMRPVRREGVYAIGEVVHRGKTLIVSRSQVYADSGKLVAAGQGTYLVSDIPLARLPGYTPGGA